jgi:hypothetical protein
MPFHPSSRWSSQASSGHFRLASILLFLCSLRVCDLLPPLRLALGPLSSGIISALSGHMGKSWTDFFDRARKNGSRQDGSCINGAQVYKRLEDGTKRRYKDAYRLWLEYALCLPLPYSRPALSILSLQPLRRVLENPMRDANDPEALEDFVQEVSYGMDGIKGEHDSPSLESLRQTWKDFAAQFRRRNDPIPRFRLRM